MSSTQKTTELNRSRKIASSFLSLTSLLLNPIFFRYSLIASGALLGLTAQIEQAQAVVPTTWTFNGTGIGTLNSTSTVATTTLPNGTVVTATISGMTWFNSAPAVFTGAGLASFPPSTPRQALGILVPQGCSTTTACGTITLTFSKPVNTPKFHISDLGGNVSAGGVVTGFRFAPVSILNGLTFSAIGQGPNTQLTNGSKTITLITANNVGQTVNGNSCGTQFGCGSYNIIGTEPYSSLTLQIDPLQKFGLAVPGDVVLLTLDVVESVQIGGTVFDDADGSKIKNGTEAGTNGGGLNAVLVNSSNQVVATTPVLANGTYTFSNIPANATYTVEITSATATIGAAPPAVTLPNNWVSTGENLNGTADGTVDSKLSVTVGTGNVTGANFGLKVFTDYGDAPNSYGIATHPIIAGLRLGVNIDAETASISNADASGDGTDDDGISSFPTLTAGATSYSIPATNITATGTGTLHAWIDFNKNGTFEAGEYKSVTVTDNVPADALNWTGITAGAAGNTFARFRFTSDASVTGSTPSGSATDGEVEDYQMSIVAVPSGISGNVFEDYGTGTSGDNIKQSAENGISGVDVNLYLDDGDQIFEPGTGDTLVGTTQVSSTTGAYTFPGLTSGQLYWVKADAAAATNRVYGGLTGDIATALPNPRLVVFNGVAIVADFPFDAGHIGVAKIQANVERTKATIDFVIKNYGPVALTNVELIDNLDLAFTAGNYTIAAAPIIQVAPTMGSTITPATNFNGATNQNLLDSTNSQLQVGESVTIRLEVNVTNPTLGGDGSGNYLNNAIVNGRTPSGIVITDKSTQSANPDRDGVTPDGNTVDSDAGLNDQDSDPTNNNSPTVVSVIGTNIGGICASPNGLIFSGQANNIYAVDVNSGKSKIMAGGAFATVNGAATNHVGHLVYYADGNSLYAWDSINNQHFTITSQFQTIAGTNIPGFNLGSGGAAFYKGSLYQGVDQGTFEIYKIDFVPGSDGRTIQSIAPVGIANLVATGKLTGTVNWGDFIISDTGLIVANGNGTQIYWSYDLNTNTFVDLNNSAITENAQLAKDGQGRLWGLSGTSTFQVEVSASAITKVAGTTKSTGLHSSADAAECAVGVNTIGDRVWNDTDGDGVQDPGEAGIGNVTIDLYWDLDDDGVIDAGEPVLETQTTNSNGNYDFTQLLFGRYIVKVSDRNNVLSTATLTTTSATLPVLLPTGRIDYNDADFGYRLTTLKPNLLLVKRITAINGLPRKNDGGSIAGYEHFDAYDNNFISIPTRPLITDPQKDTDKWPNTTSTSETNTTSTFLVGATNGGTTKPNDTIDYTIYFLSAGESEAKNVLFCDRVPANVTFSPNTFTNTTVNPGGIARGIALQLGNTLNYYTNTGDSDPARYFPPGIEPSTVYPSISCGKDINGLALPNDNGAVVVNLGDRPKATGILADDQAAGAYGFVRFRGIVK